MIERNAPLTATALTAAPLAAAQRLTLLSLFALGCAIGVIMVWNSQLSGDQSLMLDLGWSLFHDGQWLPYGMPTSAGGRSPGSLTGLLMGLPLYVWTDYRAPALLTLLLHAAAYGLLDHCMKPALTYTGRLIMMLLVWLGPWHLYYATHLWNSNYMFVFAVIHLATAQRMQTRSFTMTLLHVLNIALAMQAHTSAFVLAILSVILFFSRHLKVNWFGFALGTLLSILSFLPWALAIHADPTLAPGEKGFFMRGLIYVFPVLRGIMYWAKMASLSMASRMIDFDFAAVFGSGVNLWLKPIAKGFGNLLHLSLLVSLWFNWRFIKRARHAWRWQPASAHAPRAWFKRYATATAIAAFIAFSISPTTVMFWQAFVLLPVVCLIITFSAQALLRSRWQVRTRQVITLWGICTVVLLLMQSIAAPLYRCGGASLGGMDARLAALNAQPECVR